MKTKKKILIVCFTGILAAVSFIPSTFSWYTHNSAKEGKFIPYSDDIKLSVESEAGAVTMHTYLSDANGAQNGELTGNDLKVDVEANSVKYYKTVFSNSGSNDVMIDLETTGLSNNADYAIGTVSPILTEKAYASRASREKVSDDSLRVYFKTVNSFFNGTVANTFWNIDNGSLDTTSTVGSSNGTTNDMNIAYSLGGTEYMKMMTKCSGTESGFTDKEQYVYYADIPANAESFFFFNHWYLKTSSNQEWNRTIDITDMSPGRLYYLTGNDIDKKWKEYKVRDVDTGLVAINQHYTNVRMSMGTNVFADIGLKKDSDLEDFVPEYYGSEISYSVTSQKKYGETETLGEGETVISVNSEGLISPGNTAGVGVVTTTIRGKFGDETTCTTKVSIPENIPQVPIIQNVLVPAAEDSVPGKAEIYWYARNKGSGTMTTESIFFTK